MLKGVCRRIGPVPIGSGGNRLVLRIPRIFTARELEFQCGHHTKYLTSIRVFQEQVYVAIGPDLNVADARQLAQECLGTNLFACLPDDYAVER